MVGALLAFTHPLAHSNPSQWVGLTVTAYTNKAKTATYSQLIGLLEPRMPDIERLSGPSGGWTYRATTLLGDGFFTLQDYVKAIDYQQRALNVAEHRYGKESSETSRRLSDLVLSLYFFSDYARALPLAQRNLDLSLRLYGKESIETAQRRGELALIYSYSGRDDEAMALSHTALKTRIRLQGLQNEDTIEQMRQFAETLRHQPLGHEQAITVDLAALALSEAFIGWQSVRTATLLNDLDYFYRQDYQCSQSLPYAEEALAITIALEGPESSEVATRYHSLGTNYFCLGRMREAIIATESALTISRKRFGEKHQNVAYLEAELSDWYDQIDDSAHSEKLGRMAVATLNDTLGDQNEIAADIFDFVGSAALSWDNDFSIHLSRRFLAAMEMRYGPDETAQIDPLTNLSAALIDQGRYTQAEKLAERAVALTLERADHQSILPEEEAINALVLSEIAQDKWTEAEQHAVMALNFSEEKFGIQHPANAVPFNLFALAIRHRLPALAVLFTKKSINLEQPTGLDLKPLNPHAYGEFIAARRPRLDRLKTWLQEDHRLQELNNLSALEAPEPASQNLTREGQPLYEIAYTANEKAWLAQYENDATKRIRLGLPIRTLHRHLNHGDATPQDALLVRQLERRADENLQAFKKFYRSYPLNQPKAGPEKAVASQGNPTVRQIRNRLQQEPGSVAWVRYSVSDDALDITLFTPTNITHHRTGIARGSLNKKTSAFLNNLQQPGKNAQATATALYTLLVAPIQDQLRHQRISTLLIEASGIIRTIPFAALFDGQHYLVESLSSAFVMPEGKAIRPAPKPSHWDIAALGVSQAWPGFQPLPFVEAELAAITQASSDGTWSGNTYLNDAFNRSHLTQVLKGRHNVIHIASHFVESHGFNRNSFILLGDGSHLRLGDLEQGHYDLRHIDLLTLSACETGISEPVDEASEILNGLPETLLRLGARHVVASLWPVADQGSSRLMTAFYDHLKTTPHAKADALRQAQLAIMKQSTTEASLSSTPAHPSYWAPFVLISH
jgi:CHAT domain-containing protein